MNRTSLVALALVGVLAGGCQVVSASITSPSDWAVGSSHSVSGSVRGSSVSMGSPSGGPGSGLSAWEQDVRVYAAHSHREGRDPEAFLRGLGRLGERHGVLHVQAEPGTREAVRAGLTDAGADAEGAERFLERAGLVARVSAEPALAERTP